MWGAESERGGVVCSAGVGVVCSVWECGERGGSVVRGVGM